MAVFLRGISHVRMAALISRLRHIDLGDVDSFGMSGNLIVSAKHTTIEPLERALGGALGTLAFIRTRSALERVVARDPYGSSIMFLEGATTPTARRRLAATAFVGPRPVLRGRSLYFVYPAAVEGRRTPISSTCSALEGPLAPRVLCKGSCRGCRMADWVGQIVDEKADGASIGSSPLAEVEPFS
jgi:hypothetical protein